MMYSIFTEGLIYSVVVLGVFLTFRILNFCDMTVDGSFPLGGCILAACLSAGVAAVPALLLAFLGGVAAGGVTTVIHARLKIPDLLAGILVMTMLYSVNLRIMGNRANVSFLKIETPFSSIARSLEEKASTLPPELGVCLLVLVVVVALKLALDFFFRTDLGLAMEALGANEQMVVSQGMNPQLLRGIGICLGNGLAALSGAFAAMHNGFADVGSGTGIIVGALASLMLGEFIVRSSRVAVQTMGVLLGSLAYRGLMYAGRSYGFVVGLTSNDLKLITSLLIVLCLVVARLPGRGGNRAAS